MSKKLYNLLINSSWAITEDALRQMHAIYTAALERKAEGFDFDKQAIEKQLGRPLDNTRRVTTRGGVATIPVSGPIFRYADFFSDVSGATTVEELARDFASAMNDQSVRAILFSIDSPGGEVNGINEFSDQIHAARGVKPIIAYVSHTGASAAYWIASACDEIVVDKTAALGSIGVVAAVRDPSKENRKDIEFVSSQSPKKRPDPTTESGKTQIQTHVDALASVFVETVARNRDISTTKVIADFGQGGLLVGAEAVSAGLADRTGSYEQVLTELQNGYAPKQKNLMAASEQPEGEMKMTLWEDLKLALGGTKEKASDTSTGDKPDGELSLASADFNKENSMSKDSEILRKASAYDALQKTLREEKATALANELITASKVAPAAFDSLKAQFIAAAEDDEARPLSTGTRVGNLSAAFSHVLPHALTDERMAGAWALPNPQGEDGESRMKQSAAEQVDNYIAATMPKAHLKEARN